jgi:hypothetical protein
MWINICEIKNIDFHNYVTKIHTFNHSYDILGARMLWKPKEARILKNFNVQNEECHNYAQKLFTFTRLYTTIDMGKH